MNIQANEVFALDREKCLKCGVHAVFLIAASAAFDCGADVPLIVAADQSGPALVAYALEEGDALAERWRWTASGDPLVPRDSAGSFAYIDECKPTDGGKTILVTASAGGVAAIDAATHTAKWCAYVPQHNAGPHSADMLPDGCVAIANSTGGDALEIIDPKSAPFDPPRQRRVRAAPVPGAHGAVWHKGRNSLFVLGYTNIFEYAYSPGTMTVKELNRWDYSAKCGDAYGHDLLADGDSGFFFTNHSGVWRFSPSDGSFSSRNAIANVKSLSPDAENGDLVIVPKKGWWTDAISVLRGGKLKMLGPVPRARFYKARWLR